jgi:SpoVK/Ycf46/Vps4 family AAA+-type ATPase
LYGPSGTGKTHLARGIAGEVGGIYIELSAADILSTRVNESTIRVKKLFLEAMQIDEPTVIFIDDLEALVPERSDDIPQTSRQVSAEVLKRIEDLGSGSQVLFIGATTKPSAMDDAALSPSRFDLTLEIGLPEAEDRAEMIRDELADCPHSLGEEDIEWLVTETAGLSCAEIQQVVDEANQNAQLREAEQLDAGDFTKALLS